MADSDDSEGEEGQEREQNAFGYLDNDSNDSSSDSNEDEHEVEPDPCGSDDDDGRSMDCRFCLGPLEDEHAVALLPSSSLTALEITSHDQSYACRNCVLEADKRNILTTSPSATGHKGGAASSQSSPMEPKRELVEESKEKGEGEEEEEELCQRTKNLSVNSTPGTPVSPATPSAPINPASEARSDYSVTPGSEQDHLKKKLFPDDPNGAKDLSEEATDAAANLEEEAVIPSVVSPGYSDELAQVLNGTVAIPNCDRLEEQVSTFQQPTTPAQLNKSFPSVTPKSQIKAYYTYLLLDPMVLDKLDPMSPDLEQFRVFVESVFYVGKGKDARSSQHLKDAKKCLIAKVPAAEPDTSDKNKKNVRILTIWSQGRGVIIYQIFEHSTNYEACNREACLIKTIGKDALTNIRLGSDNREVEEWSASQKCEFGVHLLHKAFWSFERDRHEEILESYV